MKIVQNAIAPTGIKAFPSVWRQLTEAEGAPDTYITYVTNMAEAWRQDDDFRAYRIFVYMNLWTRADPTEPARLVRDAMRGAGFLMVEEYTGTPSHLEYQKDLGMYSIGWTWDGLFERADVDGEESG